MVKVYATGMGPLPWENPRLVHGSCHRTWQFVRPMLEDGHEVMLVCLRVNDPKAKEKPPAVEKIEKEGLTYILADELGKFIFPEFHQPLLDRFQPDAVIGITTPACRPLGEFRTDAPIWADIHGYVMGEAQLVAEKRPNNDFIYHFWKRYEGVLYRAACFSVTSNIQRHTMVGELGALGRLNRHTAGYEFVYSIPLAREDVEVKKTRTVIRGKTVPTDAFIVLWLGGYNYWCDPDTLFCALETAMEENDRIHFVSTGGSIHGVEEFSFPRLRKMVEQSKYRERFHFPGWVETEDVPNYLLEADAGINTDRVCYESVYGARHRIVEMLRAGLPVITTKITEISRDVDRAGAGLCSAPEDPDALEMNILELAAHPRKLMEMGARGQQLFLQKYTDRVATEPFLEWLKAPAHAPDSGRDIPRREELLYEKLRERSFWEKLSDHLKARKARKKQK